MKRRRPCKHTRLIHTKKGRKRIVVNKDVRKRNYGWDPRGGYKVEKEIRGHSEKDLERIENKPVHRRTEREQMILETYGSFPFSFKSSKKNYGFDPVPNWDKGDEKFVKKTNKEIKKLQRERQRLANSQVLDQQAQDDIKRFDKEIDRKFKVLESAAKRKDMVWPQQEEDRKKDILSRPIFSEDEVKSSETRRNRSEKREKNRQKLQDAYQKYSQSNSRLENYYDDDDD